MSGNGEVNSNFVDVKVSYIKDGQERCEVIKVEKGVEINLFDGEYYQNTYKVDDKGQLIAAYGSNGPNQVMDQIEATEEQINEILRIQRNDQEGGLSKKDYQIEEENKTKKNVQELLDKGTIYTYKKKHPILGTILPDSWIKYLAE